MQSSYTPTPKRQSGSDEGSPGAAGWRDSLVLNMFVIVGSGIAASDTVVLATPPPMTTHVCFETRPVILCRSPPILAPPPQNRTKFPQRRTDKFNILCQNAAARSRRSRIRSYNRTHSIAATAIQTLNVVGKKRRQGGRQLTGYGLRSKPKYLYPF